MNFVNGVQWAWWHSIFVRFFFSKI